MSTFGRKLTALFATLFATYAIASYYDVGGGGGACIGCAITGGTPNSVLYIDAGGLLAESTDLQFDDLTSIFTLGGSSLFTTAVDPGAGAGTAANPGSLAFFNSGGVGTLYAKFGAADTAWTNILTGTSGWSLVGNAGTTAGTNFIGTTDLVDFVIKTNNTAAMTFSSTGSVTVENLGVGVVHSDVNGLLTSSNIVNADVDNAAAIARTKLASGTAYRILANDVSGVMSENAAITASRAVASDANGQLVAATTTATQLDYLASATAALASTSTTGLLSSTDWNTFNSKQAAGNYITDLTGDVTATGPGSVAATIANNAVTDAKFRQSAGLSVVGRSANSTGNVADITAASDGEILRRSGTSIGFGSIDLAQSNAVGSSVLDETNGGTGQSTISQGDLLYGSAANTLSKLAKDTNATRYLSNTGTSNNPAWAQVDVSNGITGVVPIANGGTNNGSLSVSAGSVYYGDGTKLVALAPGTSGQVLQSNGTSAPSWVAAGSAAFSGGGLMWSAATNCQWVTTGSFADIAADADCSAPATYGLAIDPGNDQPQFEIASLPAGTYKVTGMGTYQTNASSTCSFGISDGSTTSGSFLMDVGAGAGAYGQVVVGIFEYATTQSNIVFTMQGLQSAGTGCNINVSNGSDGRRQFVMTIERIY